MEHEEIRTPVRSPLQECKELIGKQVESRVLVVLSSHGYSCCR